MGKAIEPWTNEQTILYLNFGMLMFGFNKSAIHAIHLVSVLHRVVDLWNSLHLTITCVVIWNRLSVQIRLSRIKSTLYLKINLFKLFQRMTIYIICLNGTNTFASMKKKKKFIFHPSSAPLFAMCLNWISLLIANTMFAVVCDKFVATHTTVNYRCGEKLSWVKFD